MYCDEVCDVIEGSMRSYELLQHTVHYEYQEIWGPNQEIWGPNLARFDIQINLLDCFLNSLNLRFLLHAESSS